ncbi:hypothetical protein HPB47_003902 [Ixodes persulcatus]|uniref:Uncharacterized protein n=1 Tax=Ixodes persulcatus TaxID=34615 RepID=A0AC60PIA5_IXOPE|nr:hypothetical protein HPB47_003902 [Ixodes persulcatus]
MLSGIVPTAAVHRAETKKQAGAVIPREPHRPNFFVIRASIMAEFSTLEDLTPLEVEILRRTANLGMISYDATPTCDVDDSSASESCSDLEREDLVAQSIKEPFLGEPGSQRTAFAAARTRNTLAHSGDHPFSAFRRAAVVRTVHAHKGGLRVVEAGKLSLEAVSSCRAGSSRASPRRGRRQRPSNRCQGKAGIGGAAFSERTAPHKRLLGRKDLVDGRQKRARTNPEKSSATAERFLNPAVSLTSTNDKQQLAPVGWGTMLDGAAWIRREQTWTPPTDVRNRVKNRFEHHLDAIILPGFSVVGLDSASLYTLSRCANGTSRSPNTYCIRIKAEVTHFVYVSVAGLSAVIWLEGGVAAGRSDPAALSLSRAHIEPGVINALSGREGDPTATGGAGRFEVGPVRTPVSCNLPGLLLEAQARASPTRANYGAFCYRLRASRTLRAAKAMPRTFCRTRDSTSEPVA